MQSWTAVNSTPWGSTRTVKFVVPPAGMDSGPNWVVAGSITISTTRWPEGWARASPRNMDSASNSSADGGRRNLTSVIARLLLKILLLCRCLHDYRLATLPEVTALASCPGRW